MNSLCLHKQYFKHYTIDCEATIYLWTSVPNSYVVKVGYEEGINPEREKHTLTEAFSNLDDAKYALPKMIKTFTAD